MEELSIDENSEEHNYELFKENLAERQKRREKRLAEEKAAAAIAMATTEEQSSDGKNKEKTVSTSQPSVAPVAQQPPSDSTRRSSFRERLSQKFSSKKLSPVMAKKELKKETPLQGTKVTAGKGAVSNIDDFIPDEEIDTNFLTEEGDEDHNKPYSKESEESGEDSEDNPLVAGDEDIDSEDEPAPVKPVAMAMDTKPPITDDNNDDQVDSIEDQVDQRKEQNIPPQPVEQEKTSPKPVKPVTVRPVLISAKSVELTESSEDDDSDDKAKQLVQTRKKQASQPVKEMVAVPEPKFSGLKLEHSLPSSSRPPDPPKEEVSKAKEKEYSTSVKEKKKSKIKKRKQREEVDDNDDLKQTTPAATVTSNVADDPFSSSLLDAWLDSPTGDPLAPVLQPVPAKNCEKVNNDQATDVTEERKKQKHKRHKHKHKHSATETTVSGEKKKHKHREHSTATENSEPAGNDYVTLH